MVTMRRSRKYISNIFSSKKRWQIIEYVFCKVARKSKKIVVIFFSTEKMANNEVFFYKVTAEEGSSMLLTFLFA
jgi:hypothetical protein